VDHPDTLGVVYNMASIFSHQGKHGKALEWFGRVLAAEEKVLGVDHPDTLTTVSSMALVFYDQERYEKSLEFFERALAGMEKASMLGFNGHQSMQNISRILVELYTRTGQQEQAQSLRLRMTAMTQGLETTPMEVSKKEQVLSSA